MARKPSQHYLIQLIKKTLKPEEHDVMKHKDTAWTKHKENALRKEYQRSGETNNKPNSMAKEALKEKATAKPQPPTSWQSECLLANKRQHSNSDSGNEPSTAKQKHQKTALASDTNEDVPEASQKRRVVKFASEEVEVMGAVDEESEESEEVEVTKVRESWAHAQNDKAAASGEENTEWGPSSDSRAEWVSFILFSDVVKKAAYLE